MKKIIFIFLLLCIGCCKSPQKGENFSEITELSGNLSSGTYEVNCTYQNYNSTTGEYKINCTWRYINNTTN